MIGLQLASNRSLGIFQGGGCELPWSKPPWSRTIFVCCYLSLGNGSLHSFFDGFVLRLELGNLGSHLFAVSSLTLNC